MPTHSGTPPAEEDRSEASAEHDRKLEVHQRCGVTLGVGHRVDAAPVVPYRLSFGSFGGPVHGTLACVTLVRTTIAW